MSKINDHTHSCMNAVRTHDYDRFLLSLFVPTVARPHLWALFAFNYEIAKTREVVSDTTIGLIRLQWWRDAIAEIYDGKNIRRHEVVEPLAEAIKAYDLPREDFDALIYAREFDLEGVAPANMEGLIHYCDFTTTPLMRLALKITGQEVDEEMLKSISVHYAAIGIIRAVPYMLNQRRIMLPSDIMAKNNVSEQKIYDYNKIENLPKVIDEVITGIIPYRNTSSVMESKLLKATKAMTSLYSAQIKQCQFNPFDAKMAHAPRFMAFRIWFKTLI